MSFALAFFAGWGERRDSTGTGGGECLADCPAFACRQARIEEFNEEEERIAKEARETEQALLDLLQSQSVRILPPLATSGCW